jgi:hypothetical protein
VWDGFEIRPTRHALALGLRAGRHGVFILSQTISQKEKHHVVHFLADNAAALDAERP